MRTPPPGANGQITGVVCGPGPDSPLPGAVLRAVDPRGTVVAYATTGHDGRFQLAGLPHHLSTATRAEASPDPPDPHVRPGATLHLELDGTWS
ncbi:carboxypeptidase-like regulatory domain-containing protein [Streptomyces sp. R41]|uniref:Carboxypeptidase-like regulatory domain-containing protein n=1 Tax=Streptomyces sp. R41 TaxID=3238632 RepID=A0AB39RR40_9ACTN